MYNVVILSCILFIIMQTSVTLPSNDIECEELSNWGAFPDPATSQVSSLHPMSLLGSTIEESVEPVK